MITTSTPTLEQRIVKALTDETIAANDLAVLVEETTAAIAIAENDATVAEATALDPLQSPDPVKARAVMEDAKFRATRLRNLLPRLQERFDKVSLDEQYAAWRPQFEAIKAERDAANAKFRTAFTAFVADVVPQMLRLEQINAETSRVSAAKPTDAREANGDGCWLALGPEDQLIHTIMQNLKLPDWEKPNALAWPQPVNYFSAGIVPIFQNPGANWHEVLAEENARGRIEDEARAAAMREEEGRVRNDPKLWKRG
jgi:hypothetical protein